MECLSTTSSWLVLLPQSWKAMGFFSWFVPKNITVHIWSKLFQTQSQFLPLQVFGRKQVNLHHSKSQSNSGPFTAITKLDQVWECPALHPISDSRSGQVHQRQAQKLVQSGYSIFCCWILQFTSLQDSTLKTGILWCVLTIKPLYKRWMQLSTGEAVEHQAPPLQSRGVNPNLNTESLSGFLQD